MIGFDEVLPKGDCLSVNMTAENRSGSILEYTNYQLIQPSHWTWEPGCQDGTYTIHVHNCTLNKNEDGNIPTQPTVPPMPPVKKPKEGMKLKDIISLMGDEEQAIYLIGPVGWLAAVTPTSCPKEYEDLLIDSIMPEMVEGEGYFDGCVLKVWVREK